MFAASTRINELHQTEDLLAGHTFGTVHERWLQSSKWATISLEVKAFCYVLWMQSCCFEMICIAILFHINIVADLKSVLLCSTSQILHLTKTTTLSTRFEMFGLAILSCYIVTFGPASSIRHAPYNTHNQKSHFVIFSFSNLLRPCSTWPEI